MTCRELTDALYDYRCGTLARVARLQVATHLSQCDRCARYARGYDTVVRLAKAGARSLPEPIALPESLAQRILAAVSGPDRQT